MKTETEFKLVKVKFEIHRDLSDHWKPRYVAKYRNQVVADGLTLNEVRECVNQKLKLLVQTDFMVMAE